MTDLENTLYKISTNQVNKTDLENYFDKTAVLLLQHSQIVTKNSVYNLNEIEFYFSSQYYDHIDPYAHSNIYKSGIRQQEFGEWYFHRFKSIETYPLQKFRGIDLTFGSKEHKNFGGILIRRIQNVKTGQTIEGISNIVGILIKDNGIEFIQQLTSLNGKFVFEINSPLHIRLIDKKLDKTIYKGLRHKLPSATNETETLFFNKYYCYSNDLNLKIVNI
jgi:hypothetical protein